MLFFPLQESEDEVGEGMCPTHSFNSISYISPCFSPWQYLKCSDANSISVETKPWRPAKLNDCLTITNTDLFWILLHSKLI